ncbi:MAG: hypothetical protein LBE91_18005 [Tannerella sp.]|jgi:hypothetical protein|nr:hypothetical protein [Tannerella sp.]
MKLTKLTQSEEYKLRAKVGDLTRFKEKILKNRINLDDFEIFKDEENRSKVIYIALKHNPRLYINETGIDI